MVDVARGEGDPGDARAAAAPRRTSLRLRLPVTAPSLRWSDALGAELQQMAAALRHSMWILLDQAERGCPAPREFVVEQVRLAHQMEAVLSALRAGGERRPGSFDLWAVLQQVTAAEGCVRVEAEPPALAVEGSQADAMLLDAVRALMVRWGGVVAVRSDGAAMVFECARRRRAGEGEQGLDRSAARQYERQAEALGLRFTLTGDAHRVRATLRSVHEAGPASRVDVQGPTLVGSR